MRLTEYLAEAVASRKTGKYRDTSLIDKISEFTEYGDMLDALSRCSKYVDVTNTKKPHDTLMKRSSEYGVVYTTETYTTPSRNQNWLFIYICGRNGIMVKLTYSDISTRLISVDIFEWNGVSYAPIDSYDGRVIEGGVDEVKKLIYDSTK